MKVKLKNLQLRMALIGPCTVAIMFGLSSGSVLATHDHPEKNLPAHEQPHKAEPPTGGHKNLAAAATNPIANLVQFQVNDSFSPSSHNASGYSNTTVIQPVIPFKLPWESMPLLITRTTLPYVVTADLPGGIGRKDGFGDTEFLSLFSPKLETKGVQVAIGTNLIIPTAGDNQFTGSGKWSIGPAALYINMKKPGLQWGLFGWADFSFASASGGSDRTHVSQISLQPFITQHFKKGWYVASMDVPQKYDFNSNNWTLAIGPKVGRVMKFGEQPVNVFGAVYYNPIDNDNAVSAEWTIKVGVTFLFPE
jgi:hypothetical protein